ncbi:MAG TPA: rod shape-determining protein MreD [Bacillota bacterium]|nr:rod shape-determining protein MreD [Bacillota bacterium]
MRWLILSIGLILSVAIQATWFHALHLPGQVIPDLILIMTISYGLLKGSDQGFLFGFAGGFLLDLLSGGGGLIGVHALTKMATGFVAGLMEKNIFKDNLLVPALAVFIGTLFCESLNVLLYIAFSAEYQFFHALFLNILPLAIYNSILAPVVYFLLLKLERYLIQRAQ